MKTILGEKWPFFSASYQQMKMELTRLQGDKEMRYHLKIMV